MLLARASSLAREKRTSFALSSRIVYKEGWEGGERKGIWIKRHQPRETDFIDKPNENGLFQRADVEWKPVATLD